MRTLQERMSGIQITRTKSKRTDEVTIFIPLPVELWRPCWTDSTVLSEGCSCEVCKADGSAGYWDTIAISANPTKAELNRVAYEHTVVVHHPALHPEHVRRTKALADKAVA